MLNDRQPARLIKVGIVGYGNLGRGAELAVTANDDMQLVGVFSRRDPASVTPQLETTSVWPMDALDDFSGRIDVLILCGSSKDDLPRQTPELARRFCVVDSFDTHARIPEHFGAVDSAAREGRTTALISAGWDPGLFSIQRVMAEALVPGGDTYTFWGRGLSQGHSDAVRQVPGVAGGVQYTLPSEDSLEEVRSGRQPQLGAAQMHRRECFVVLKPGADPEEVRRAIVDMPHYFADYDTQVHFIDAATLAREHGAMPHGGRVVRAGKTSADHAQVLEYGLKLDSNPEFTASVLVAYARAVARLHGQKNFGALTVLDIPPGLISPLSPAELRKRYL